MDSEFFLKKKTSVLEDFEKKSMKKKRSPLEGVFEIRFLKKKKRPPLEVVFGFKVFWKKNVFPRGCSWGHIFLEKKAFSRGCFWKTSLLRGILQKKKT